MRVLICVVAVVGGLNAQDPKVQESSPKPAPALRTTPKAATKKTPDIVATIIQPENTGVRTIHYNDRIVEKIHCKANFTTLIVLPSNEKVMEAALGNTDEWTANPSAGANIAYVRPDRQKVTTNLNVVAASGNVYSFLVVEGDGTPDLKVFVDTKDSEILAAAANRPKWVLATELDQAKTETERASREASDTKANYEKKVADMEAQRDRDIAAFRTGFPSSLKYDYVLKKEQREFGFRAMAHSRDFTYIWADPSETPALYEQKDGKPALIQYDYADGVYVVPKVLNSGWLTVGKKKLEFNRAAK